MKRWLTNQLLFFFLAAFVAGQDGSTPEEICPCQAEDSCQDDDRHIFGRDESDIQKFGLIPPCRNFGEYPCCPLEPPPPKETKLTKQDLQGFSPAELAELGIMPEGTIGSSSLPLAEASEQPDQSKLFEQNQQQPIDITQPGAASLAPHGAAGFTSKTEVPKQYPIQQKPLYPVQQPIPSPKMQYRPVYQPPPPVYQKPVYPMYYPPRQYYPPPQMYRPVHTYQPMYRPAYQKH